MKIANPEVTAITNDKAKVGCTTVYRTEIEALLEEMKKVPMYPKYQIRLCHEVSSSTHVFMKVDTDSTGFFAVSPDRNPSNDFYPCSSFTNKTLWLCLRPKMAEDLVKALTEGLKHIKETK